MTSRDSDVLKTDISSEYFIIPAIKSPDYCQTGLRFASHNEGNIEALRKILKRLAGMDLPGKDHVEGYLCHLTRLTADLGNCTVVGTR